MSKKNAVRRMLAVAVAVIAAGGVSAHAAESGSVSRFYMVEVAPAQDQAFQAGMKTWLKCLHEHADTRSLWAWSAETGDLGRYVFESDTRTWAGIDERSPAGKACSGDFNTDVMPHVSKAVSWVARDMPKLSHDAAKGAIPAYVFVANIKLKPGQGPAFEEALGKFAAAANKSKWEGYWFTQQVVAGGHGAPDYNMVWPNKSWAEIGQDPSPSAKAMMESAYGKAGATANRKQYLDAVEHSWSSIYRFDKELSYIPAK